VFNFESVDPSYVSSCLKNLYQEEQRFTQASKPYTSNFWQGKSPAAEVELFKYRFNAHNGHGTEYYYDPDVLCLGCSVTVGQGLPHEFTWPKIVESFTGLKVNVVGDSGASITRIWNAAQFHMAHFGRPQKILFLMPNLERIFYPSTRKEGWYSLDYLYGIKNYVKENSQSPFFFKDFDQKKQMIVLESAIEQFCLTLTQMYHVAKLFGIKIHLFSWHKPTHDVLLDISKHTSILDNFVLGLESSFRIGHKQVAVPDCGDSNCVFNSVEVYGLAKRLWEWADEKDFSHPGLHAHLHWAEVMGQLKLSDSFISDIKIGER